MQIHHEFCMEAMLFVHPFVYSEGIVTKSSLTVLVIFVTRHYCQYDQAGSFEAVFVFMWAGGSH